MEITLCVSQSKVFDEVVQTAEYTGSKMDDDTNAYKRISITDENLPELRRFWDECRGEVSKAFMRMLCREGMAADGDRYELVLDVSVAFDRALLPGMELGLFSYFVQGIAAKWYSYVNKKEAGEYASACRRYLEEIKEKAFYKKKPVRPTYG